MTLDALAALVPGGTVRGDGGIVIDDLAYDARTVGRGALFFCIPGARFDGHDFAGDAVAAGAVALVVERPLDVAVPQLLAPSVRRAMEAIAAPFFGDPSRVMPVVGITGTNGKTTSTYLLASVSRARGATPGLIGTVETRIGDRVLPAERTTPESIDLQRLLARMRGAGVDEVAMEVSSGGLAFGRTAGTRFACAAFTNLSQDHLEDHGTMEAYFEAKASLFTRGYTDRAVLSVDDEHGRILRDRVDLDVVTVALDAPADVRATAITLDAAGADATVDAAGTALSLRVPIPGRYNVANAVGVVGIGVALGWDLEAVAAGIAACPGVPGRLERIDAGQDFTVLVDYAHTPDALENVLRAARELTGDGARLLCVFGCGGDRDRTKRPLMGRAVTDLADLAIITSDNPRSEDPASIIAMIEEGARAGAAPWVSIVDRRAAIAHAVDEAGPGDVIVIAGKGHETGQRFADHVIDFDDRTVAREALEARS